MFSERQTRIKFYFQCFWANTLARTGQKVFQHEDFISLIAYNQEPHLWIWLIFAASYLMLIKYSIIGVTLRLTNYLFVYHILVLAHSEGDIFSSMSLCHSIVFLVINCSSWSNLFIVNTFGGCGLKYFILFACFLLCSSGPLSLCSSCLSLPLCLSFLSLSLVHMFRDSRHVIVNVYFPFIDGA